MAAVAEVVADAGTDTDTQDSVDVDEAGGEPVLEESNEWWVASHQPFHDSSAEV